MGITKSTVKVGQKPPKEAIQEARKAARQPINYTEEAPPFHAGGSRGICGVTCGTKKERCTPCCCAPHPAGGTGKIQVPGPRLFWNYGGCA